MLRMLKILCILLKVFMLMRTAIAFSSKEDCIAQDTASIKIIDFYDYMSSNIESVHFDNETVRNEVALQEGITPSPENIPSEPTFPRAFVKFGNKLTKKDIFVIFRWNEPKFTNGMIQKYRIQYWFIENLNRTIQTSVDIVPAWKSQYEMFDLKSDTMYYFQVQAHNEVGAGPYTKFINVSTTHENPIPLLLVKYYIINRYFEETLDVDLQIASKLNEYKDEYGYGSLDYSSKKYKIFGITTEQMAINTKPNYTKIDKLEHSVYSLCIDWIARNLYWISASYKGTYIKLDLWQQMGIVKCDNILEINKLCSFLNILPSRRYFYWIGTMTRNQNTIMQSDFDGKNIKPFLKNDDKCLCPYKSIYPGEYPLAMQIETTNVDKPLIYWISKYRLFATDIYGCSYNQILSADQLDAGNQTYFDYLTIDKINIYLYIKYEKLLYILKKKDALLESKENAFKRVQKVRFQDIPYYLIKFIPLHKFLPSDFPYPPICLIPNMKDYRVEEVSITAKSIFVRLPEPIPNSGCDGPKFSYNLFNTAYNISVNYLTCLDNDLNKSEEFNVQTYERHYEFQNLTPFTEYTLKLALSNDYIDGLSIGLRFGADVKLTTMGKLNVPEDVTVQVLTPTLATVYWMPPKKLNCVAVKYEVHWMQLLNSTQGIIQKPVRYTNPIDKPERTLDGKFFTIIQSLLTKQKFKINVRVYPTVSRNFFIDSLPKIVYMSEPNNLILSGVSTNGMNISWIPSANLTIHTGLHYILEYKNDAMREWQIANNTEENNDKVSYYIENLLPRTLYKFRLILRYSEYMEDFKRSPNEEEFIFKTLGDATKIPSAPGIPTVTRLSNFTYQLNWELAQARESQVTLYRLEGLTVENDYKESNQINKNKHWSLYYNGTDNYWVITRDMDRKYRFRVQAENAYGFGAWSEYSVVVDLTESIEISAMQYYLPLIFTLVVALIMCNVYYFYCSYRRRKENNEQVLSPIIELAALYEMPYGKVQLNALYASKSQYNPDEFALTIIKEKQITLANLLGSGAFGKVFQGTLKNLEGSDTTPVAIKMLRKNASSREKKKLLQEAKLMSHFCHKNVLRLLGICLDADSPLLILELMEVGDLLKYLRESRMLQPSDPYALRLQDLLAMCEDVARGCCYLEQQHFVHRDLACRNCLISAKNRENRIVKIGDFGLTKDIYRDDYYRKKGEDLLPVRWMAPESLMDGIFTSQSDVWAFGVLMWEITSLGQQPYCVKTNSEVLQYVCAGGKLSIPIHCPPMLYQLMLSCWNVANDRPNFIFCLENILTLRDNIEDAILSSVDIIRRVQVDQS